MTMAPDDDLLRFLDRDGVEALFQERRAKANDGPETQVASGAKSPAISLMITQRQRMRLRDLGYSADAIRSMTPAEAHAHLRRDEPER